MKFVDQVWRELRLALRRLAATPVFTLFAVVSLALGLGVTTAVYSAVATLLWNTSSIADADELAVFTRRPPGARVGWRSAISRTDFDDLRSRVKSVPALAASSLATVTFDDGMRTSPFTAQAVTGNFFAMVRLPLYFGRGIQEADDRSGAKPAVVLSDNFWQSKAGGDPAIVGRTVRIASHPFVVIGVAAERGRSALDVYGQLGLVDADGWIPLTDKPIAMDVGQTPRGEPDLTVIARMQSGADVRTVATEVGGIGAALDRSVLSGDLATGSHVPRSWSATSAAAIAREQSATLDSAGIAVVLLVALVLVVACTNIANLTLGRGTSRVHEFTVQRALGASRARLVRQQCVESVVLAALGALGAFLVTSVVQRYFTTDIPLTNFKVVVLRPKLSTPALMVAAVSLLLSLVVFGIVPALQLTRDSLRARLSGADAGASPARWKGRRRLTTLQVTISTALLLIAFAATRAVTAEARHDPGFDLPHLAIGVVNLRWTHGDVAGRQRLIKALDTAAQLEPGFDSVALTAGLPIGRGVRVRQLAQVSLADQASARQTAPVVSATPGIFRTLGIPILRGRGFDDRDTSSTHPVIVISEHVARQVFGSPEVVGRQMRYHGPSDSTSKAVEVIGVARDTDTLDLFDRRLGAVYIPLAQHDARTVFIVGRTAGDPAPMARTFAGIVRRIDPELAVEFASTGPMAMTPPYVMLRKAATLSGGLSILSVTLAMLGLYGVLSHVVVRRTREIGVRLALGADPARLRRMIVGEGVRPVLWGVGFGLMLGLWTRLVLRATDMGRHISAIDSLAFAAAIGTFVTAGFLACYLPARRASNVDPNVALREL